MHTIPDIIFTTIDIDSVESVEDNPEAVTFDIVLSSTPQAHWLEEFTYLYDRSQFALKPPIQIVGDRMRIMYLPRYGDDLQGFVMFLGGILERATLEARRTIDILQTDEKEQTKARFRATLSSLDLPFVADGKVTAGNT